jgi:hypothetical protein
MESAEGRVTTFTLTSAFARLALTAAVLGSACALAREPLLVTVPQAGLRPVAHLDSIFDYRTAAATVVSVVQSDLGFVPFPVTFKFFPDRDAFEKALLEMGYDTALAQSVATTMTAVGGHRGVLLNDGRFSSLPWPGRIAMLAHELGHTVQYELGGGWRGTSDQWLREGFAEWLSVRVLERLSVASMTEVRRERLRGLRAAGRSKTPRLADLVTFSQWVKASGQTDATTYFLAFLAVDSLLERHGVPAVLAYFKRFASSQDRVGNFRSAFGEDLQTFEAALAARLWGR